jgi:hypothetical protein
MLPESARKKAFEKRSGNKVRLERKVHEKKRLEPSAAKKSATKN